MLTRECRNTLKVNPGTNKSKAQEKRITHSKHSEEKLLPKCKKDLRLLGSIGLKDKVWCGLGLWRHSHKGLTTAHSRGKTTEKIQSKSTTGVSWARHNRMPESGLGTQQTVLNLKGIPFPAGEQTGSQPLFRTLPLKKRPSMCYLCQKSQLNNKHSWRTRKRGEAFGTSMIRLKEQKLCK